MRLGIAVVYLVKEESEPLLDLHLEWIARHTEVPYTIYAAANRLLPHLREKLGARPEVRLCTIPDTPLRHAEEHSYYLARLLEQIWGDGATHAAIMHVDSFPVRRGWVGELVVYLERGNALAGLFLEENDERMAPNTAFIFVPREFHERYGPYLGRMPVPESNPRLRAYRRLQDPIRESGDPYGFALYEHRLPWHKMRRSNVVDDHPIIGGIYDDLVFHLGGAARHDKKFWGDLRQLGRSALKERLDRALYSRIPGRLATLAPRGLRRLWNPARAGIEEANRAAFERVRDRLLADPDGYIEYLRTGQGGDAVALPPRARGGAGDEAR